MRMTKVVATIGPACDSPEVLRGMIEAGLDVARINLSHGSHEEHAERIARIRQTAAELDANVAIMADTRGFEIRTGSVTGGGVEIRAGDAFTLYAEDQLGGVEGVSVSYKNLGAEVMPGALVLLDDGALELRVDRVEPGALRCTILRGGWLGSGRGVNLPDHVIQRGALGAGDREDLMFAAEQDLDYVAASFVRDSSDVQVIQALLESADARIPVIAKIENRAAVQNLEAIVDRAAGIMVARGDLGVEMPLEEVPLAQKRIIHTTVGNGKPVITATQMLSSMERSTRPTRAEVSDVANAILDGTSAVMLSAETAVGRYPVEAVRTMAKLALRAESALSDYGHFQQIRPEPSSAVTEAVSQAAITMAHHLQARAIVTLTESGFTSRSISKHRPRCPILAVTPNERVVRKLALNWGVTAVHYKGEPDDDAMIDRALTHLRTRGFVGAGDRVVTTTGVASEAGSTNRINVLTI